MGVVVSVSSGPLAPLLTELTVATAAVIHQDAVTAPVISSHSCGCTCSNSAPLRNSTRSTDPPQPRGSAARFSSSGHRTAGGVLHQGLVLRYNQGSSVLSSVPQDAPRRSSACEPTWWWEVVLQALELRIGTNDSISVVIQVGFSYSSLTPPDFVLQGASQFA